MCECYSIFWGIYLKISLSRWRKPGPQFTQIGTLSYGFYLLRICWLKREKTQRQRICWPRQQETQAENPVMPVFEYLSKRTRRFRSSSPHCQECLKADHSWISSGGLHSCKSRWSCLFLTSPFLTVSLSLWNLSWWTRNTQMKFIFSDFLSLGFVCFWWLVFLIIWAVINSSSWWYLYGKSG